MSFPGPGHCRQQASIWAVTPWPGFALSWVNLANPMCLFIQNPPLLGPTDRLSWSFHGGHWWHLIGWGYTSMITFTGIMVGWALRFPRQIGMQEDHGCSFPYVAVNTMEIGNWAVCTSSTSTWTHMQCPQTSVQPWTCTAPNGGIVILWVVHVCHFTFSTWNSLGTVRSKVIKEAPPQQEPFASLGIYRTIGVTRTWLNWGGPTLKSL